MAKAIKAPPAKGQWPLEPPTARGSGDGHRLRPAISPGRQAKPIILRARRQVRVDEVLIACGASKIAKAIDPAARSNGFKGPSALCRRRLDCLTVEALRNLGDRRQINIGKSEP